MCCFAPLQCGREAPPSHTYMYPDLALHAKIVAPPPSLVPVIAIFVPPTSNLNKNPVPSPPPWDLVLVSKYLDKYTYNSPPM